MSIKLKAALLSVLILATTIPLIPNAHADTRTLGHTHESVTATNQDTWKYRLFPRWSVPESELLTPLVRPMSKDTAINAGKRALGERRCKLLYAHPRESASLYILQFTCNNVLTVVEVRSLYKRGRNGGK